MHRRICILIVGHFHSISFKKLFVLFDILTSWEHYITSDSHCCNCAYSLVIAVPAIHCNKSVMMSLIDSMIDNNDIVCFATNRGQKGCSARLHDQYEFVSFKNFLKALSIFSQTHVVFPARRAFFFTSISLPYASLTWIRNLCDLWQLLVTSVISTLQKFHIRWVTPTLPPYKVLLLNNKDL
jgi:hypothetical protein